MLTNLVFPWVGLLVRIHTDPILNATFDPAKIARSADYIHPGPLTKELAMESEACKKLKKPAKREKKDASSKIKP